MFFSEILKQNNDYTHTLEFGRGWLGEVRIVTFSILEVPEYKSAMLIYTVYSICMYICMYKNARYRRQFWTNFHDIN